MNWQLLKHPLQQPFILSTGLFALVHSTWAIGTMFSGKMPSPGLTAPFLLWIIPPALFSFSIDIGQIATSAEIRNGQRTYAKYATFLALAATTFYLQFLYMVHHMPALSLAPGVVLFPSAAETLRNAALWILPALLPISTTFYTLGNEKKKAEFVNHPEKVALEGEVLLEPIGEILSGGYRAICEDCGWTGDYETEKGATNGLNGHRGHCPGIVVSPNGRH